MQNLRMDRMVRRRGGLHLRARRRRSFRTWVGLKDEADLAEACEHISIGGDYEIVDEETDSPYEG